jgi:hypothetical protein
MNSILLYEVLFWIIVDKDIITSNIEHSISISSKIDKIMLNSRLLLYRALIKSILGIMAERFNAAVLKTVYLIGTFVRIKLIPSILL